MDIPFRDQLQRVLEYFKIYFSNPIQGMKLIPDWSWSTLLTVQLSMNVVIGLLASIVSSNLLTLFILPIMSLLTCFFGACFFYFLFFFIYNREISFHRLYTIVFLALLPFSVLRIISSVIAPINLIGFAITLIFLTIGFVENFKLPKKTMLKLFAGLFTIYFIIWSYQQIKSSKKEMGFRKNETNESANPDDSIEDIDKIEDEIEQNF